MRTKVTLVLLFLNVAVFFYIFKFEPGWRTEHIAQEARRRVLGAEAANIQSLEIGPPNAPPAVSLVRRGDAWFLTKPFEWPANRNAVQRIVTDLLLLDHETSFAVPDLVRNGQKLSDYGLDPPALTVTFSSADPSGERPAGAAPAARPSTLGLGNKTPDGSSLYLLSPDGQTVHVVGRSLADSLSQPLDQLRSDTLFSIPVFEVRLFSLSAAAATSIRLRRDGNRWSFEAPVQARASELATNLTLSELNGLRVKSFLPAVPPEVATANPLRISLEGNNRSETLLLYNPVSAAAADQEYYARMDKKDALFTVAIPAELKRNLDNAQVALRERRLLEFEARAVSALTLSDPSAPGQPELKLQRLDAPAGTPADATPWQIVRNDPGQAPQTQAADLKAVQRLLEQLALLSAKPPGGFLNDAPTRADLETWGFNRPVRTLAITVAGAAGAPGSTLNLRIGVSADRVHAYAQVGGPESSVYEVDPGILAETPVTPLAYRDRLLRELPAGAQITGVKLTDLASRAVLVDKTFPPATGGQPPDAALQRLVDQLRVLRAKTFVEPASVDRPWHYQLDVAISLGGGATAAQGSSMKLLLGDRLGASRQLATSEDFGGAVWELEQRFTDALWPLIYPNDPGPAAPAPAAPAEAK
ncbi:MAG TPA: DUF4340 domain-containing protein [Opitutaceae bacterium]|nr:DUF4340 domain-containing protein [Opitutaceae bacterium]